MIISIPTYIYVFDFYGSTNKWGHTVFFFYLIFSLGIMSSKSIHIIKWQCFLLHLLNQDYGEYVPIFLFILLTSTQVISIPMIFLSIVDLLLCDIGKPWPHFLGNILHMIDGHWSSCSTWIFAVGACRCCSKWLCSLCYWDSEFWGSEVAL